MLTKNEVAFYEQEGFLIKPGVFSEADCEEMKEAALPFADKEFSVCLNIHRRSDYFLAIAKSEVMTGIVAAVQKTPFDITNDQFLYKKGGTPYARQAWEPHQDSAYTQAPYGTYMQVHILLDAQSKENGGLYFYPTSHRESLLPYTYRASWRENFDAEGISHPGWKCEVPAKYKRVDIDAEVGSIFLQHGNLIHGSYANLSDRGRAQYSVAYLNKDTKINEGEASVKIPVAV